MNEDVHDRPLAAPNTPSTTRSDGGSGAPADEFALGAPIDTLVGDRLCVRCHHNLFGQPIFRESRYGLVLSRCPECGGFTPLLEYPTLGRWTRRLGAITAAAVLALLLFGALSSAGIMALLAYGTGELSTTTVQTAVQKSMNETGSGSSWWSAGPEVAAWTSKTGGVAAVVRELGGWPRCISIDVIYSASALAIVAFMLGVVISVALFAQRGIRLALLAVVPSLIAAAGGIAP